MPKIDRFDVFQDLCDQEIMVHDDLLFVIGNEEPSKKNSYAPSINLTMIAEAGNRLRLSPDEPLIDKPFEVPEDYRRDVAAMTLARILNDSLQRVGYTKNAVTSDPTGYVSNCSETEGNFVETFHYLQWVRKMGRKNSKAGTVIYGRNGPVAIRKDIGEHSTLSLKPICINGVRYPAGSILAVNGLDTVKKFSDGATQPRLADAKGVAFLRLSAFAYEPARRKLFEMIELDMSTLQSPKTWKQFTKRPFKQYSAAAQSVAIRLQPN